MDGQELTWVASHMPRWFTHLCMVAHARTNWARCVATKLLKTELAYYSKLSTVILLKQY